MLNPPILILSDESTKYSKKIVGAISISLDAFYSLEKWILEYRIENKIFGEIKWEKVKCKGRYFNCYLEIIDKVLNTPGVRFHSDSYSGGQYEASYALVRSISWKLTNCGYRGDVGILFDEKDSAQVDITRDLLSGDSRFKHNVIFCTETDSKVFNTMQVVDLICGSLSYKINCVLKSGCDTNSAKVDFIKSVESIDTGLEMDLSFGKLWDYNDSKKIQHYYLS